MCLYDNTLAASCPHPECHIVYVIRKLNKPIFKARKNRRIPCPVIPEESEEELEMSCSSQEKAGLATRRTAHSIDGEDGKERIAKLEQEIDQLQRIIEVMKKQLIEHMVI